MKNKAALLLFMLFLNTKIFASHMSLEPSQIGFKETNILVNFLTQQQLRVVDVIYKEKVIFRICENLIPTVNSIILASDQKNLLLTYKIPSSDNIIKTNEDLNKILMISDAIFQFVHVSPEKFILRSQGYSKKNYTLTLLLDSRKLKFKISHGIYKELEKIKFVAQNRNYKIKVNLNFMSHASGATSPDAMSSNFLLVQS